MKQLTWKLVLPLTIISFVIFTKWWYVIVVDGPDEILTGFPVPYMCPGWHTSLSLQIFVSGLIIDLLTYFTSWLILTFIVHQFVIKIRLNKTLTIILLTVAGLLTAGMILIGSNPDNIYTYERDFEIEKLESGYKFIWENQTRPDYYKYHPEIRKE
jgi:hypothetical protein